MAAFESGDVDLQLGPALRLALGDRSKCSSLVQPPAQPTNSTPSSSESRLSMIRPFKRLPLTFVAPVKDGLLVHGEQQLERAVGNGRVVGGRLCGGHPDAVVGASVVLAR